MVKDKLSLLSSSLKTRGCFFCLAAFVFLAFSLTSPAFARQVPEYNTATGLWGYSEKDAAFSSSSPQGLEYSTVTGLWDYSTKDALSSFSNRQAVGYNPVTGLWH